MAHSLRSWEKGLAFFHRKPHSMVKNQRRASRTKSAHRGIDASSGQPLALPKPGWNRSKPLLEALKLRRTIRAVSHKALPLQTISNLFWAAFGVNRLKGPLAWLAGPPRPRVIPRRLISMLP